MYFARTGSKGKISSDYYTKDAYRLYSSRKKSGEKRVYLREFNRVFCEIMDEIMKKVIYENYDFRMPHRLGNIYVVKHKAKMKLDNNGNIKRSWMFPDWKATKDLWTEDEEARKNKTIVYHMNEHFDRYTADFYYDKRTCLVRNQGVYKFVVARKWKNELSKAIKECNVDFFEK